MSYMIVQLEEGDEAFHFHFDEGGKQQECYVRVGNSSKPYTLDEFYEYSRRRFK